jgi:hypothetical protein
MFICLAFFQRAPVVRALDNGPCSESILRSKGILVVNCDGNNVCDATPAAASTAAPAANGSSIYVLGDSITVLSRDEITELVENSEKGFSLSKINADGGRAITYDSGGNPPAPPGLQAVTDDAEYF